MSAASSSSASAAAAASSASAAAAAAPSSRAQPLVDDTEDERKESDTNMSDAKMEPVKGLDDGDANDDLKLKSQEGEVFLVPKKICLMSELIKTMSEGDKEADDIPLLNVKADVLKKVVEYMRYHAENPPKEIEKPLKSPNMNEVVSQLVNRETTCIKLTHLSPYSDQAADFLAQAYAGDEWLVVDECGPQLRASIKMWLESKEFALYNRHIVDDNKPVFDALKSCQAKELEKVRDVLQHLPIICPSEVTAPSWRGVKREERPVSITGRRSGHGTISLLMSFTTARKKRSAVKVSRLMKALFDPASRPDKAALGDKKYAAITLSHLSTTIGDRPIARCDVNPFRTVYEDKDVNRGRGNCAVEFQTAVEKAEWKAAAASVKCSHQPPCTFYDFTAGAWATAQAAYISLHEKKQEIANKNKVNKTTAADSISQSRDKYKTNSSVMYFMLCSLRNGVASEDVFGDDLEGTLEAAGVDLADSADEEDELEEAELDVHYALVRSIMGGNKDKKSHGLYCCFVCKKDSREGKLERESANLRLHLKEHGLHLGRLQSGHKAAGQYARKKRSRDEDAEEEEEYDPPAASAAAAAATYPRQQ